MPKSAITVAKSAQAAATFALGDAIVNVLRALGFEGQVDKYLSRDRSFVTLFVNGKPKFIVSAKGVKTFVGFDANRTGWTNASKSFAHFSCVARNITR